MITFPTAETWSGEPPFSAQVVLDGSEPDPASKGRPGHIWLELDGIEDCIRFYGTDVPGDATPLIYLEGDASQRSHGSWVLFDGYARQSPASVQAWAEQVALASQRPFVVLARPGVYGSSGNHQYRRRPREVALIDAAVTALKHAFAWSWVDLAGFSGGGHLVACLMATRSDIGSAVIASGNLAVRQRNIEHLRLVDVTGFSDFVDPIDLVGEVARHPPRKVVVLTDPKDCVVSSVCQKAYVDALSETGVSVDHRMVPALDPKHHVLRDAALLAAVSAG